MHTYFLSDDDVRRFAADFVDRLTSFGNDAPLKWITLGVSGDKIAAELAPIVQGTSLQPTAITRVAFDRSTQMISNRDGGDFPNDFGDESILVIDGAVHSGSSMRHLVDSLHARGAQNVLTYSLVIKRSSEFIPSFFGLMIGEHDRAFFQLDRIPNNRLLQKLPFGSLRSLRESDVHRSPDNLACGLNSLDKVTFGDLWYYVRTQHSHAYVYEVGGKVAGFIHFKKLPKGLFIDLIANGTAYQGYGIGGVMMRWAETFARSHRLASVELWAIEERASFYLKHGYDDLGEKLDLGGGEKYVKMRRKLLYNIKPEYIAAA